MTEGKQHRKYKERTAGVLRANPDYQSVQVEYDTGIMVPTSLGPRPYIADIYAERIVSTLNGALVQKNCVEIDGKRGHAGTIAHRKNVLRDARLKENRIATCRLPTKWFMGKNPMSDDDILRQVAWSLDSENLSLVHVECIQK